MTGGSPSPAGRRQPGATAAGRASAATASDGGVDRYAVIGNPIAHSKSPLIHEAFARATGQRMRYERLLAPLDGFGPSVQAFRTTQGVGLNVTTPFKLQAFALAGEHSARARSARACNTLAWRGDHWLGDNTDGAGLVRDLLHNLGEAIAGKDVLVLGAGGAAHGIVGPLLAEAPCRLVIANRTHATAFELAEQFDRDGPICAQAPDALSGQRFDIVINATSVGLDAPIPPALWPRKLFAAGSLAYDLIYADEATPFLAWAQSEGAFRVADGLGVLIEQAAESFALWRGVRPETGPVFRLLRAARGD